MPEIKDGTLNSFYNTSPVQYIIPPYQRTITWPSDQWQALLNDIFSIMNDQKKTHLIQMFQLQSDETATKFIVGDGQQRLVHTSLILLALAHSLKDISEMKEIAGNRFAYELQATYGRILPDNDSQQAAMLSFYSEGVRKAKVVVGPSNQKAYEAIVFWNYKSLPKEKSKKCIVQHAFEFYKRKISEFLLQDNVELGSPIVDLVGLINYENDLVGNLSYINNKANAFLNTMEYRLVFASAHFKSREEMQASYENTNSRSVALTESELIKNNIFKHFDPLTKQEELVSRYWQFFDNDYWINKDLGDRNLYDKTSEKRPDQDRLDELFYYHLTAAMRKYGSFTRKDHHATFKAFKNFYERESIIALNKKKETLDNSAFQKFDDKLFISSYYEEILKSIRSQGELYRKLDARETFKGDVFEERSKDFYYRVIDACNMRAAFSILFMLREKEVSYERFDAILSIFESFIIRKALSPNTPSNNIYNSFFRYIQNNTSIEQIKSDLLKDTTKTGAWEGDIEILRHQMKKMWKSSDHVLAVLLITDFENSGNHVMNGMNQRVPYRREKSSIEHFMPQNPLKPQESWPISSNETGARERLTYNFGNLFIVPDSINGKLGNLSYQNKKKILSEHLNPNGSLGLISLDFAYSSNRWDQKQIEAHLRDKLGRILKQYAGPSRTINKHQGSQLLVDNLVKANESIFYLNKRLEEFEVVVQEDGALFYQQSVFSNFQELMKLIAPEENNKEYLAIWNKKIANQYVPLKQLNVF